MKVVLTEGALRDLNALDDGTQRRIVEKLDFFASSSDPLYFANALTDHSVGSYRYRIGDYRAIFDVNKNVIVIMAIGHRRDIYR